MKDLIKEVKFKRLPKHEKYLLDILGNLEIIYEDENEISYGANDKKLFLLHSGLLHMNVDLYDKICKYRITEELEFDLKVFMDITAEIKTLTIKLFKENIKDVDINKIEIFGKTRV